MAEQGPKAYTPKAHCRVCGYGDFRSILDLGSQPLANSFRKPGDVGPEPRYPLHLVRCPNCELLQLDGVVDPQVMYGAQYLYRSGYSQGWADHCHALAKEIGPRRKVLEIGCLDGVMLRHCRDNGCEVQGVDPSSPVQDLPILREFFVRGWRSVRTGQYDVIVAQNVFGHVDDAFGFLEAVAFNLAPDGYAVIECPWSVDLIERCRWDTIYHEHLSYWGIRPMQALAALAGLTVNRVRSFPEIHGGTLRYYLSRGGVKDASVEAAWAAEQFEGVTWRNFRFLVSQQVDHWEKWFALQDPGSVAAYGASAKFNTFCNTLSETPNLTCVFDDSPAKIGLVTPGWHLPVRAPTREAMEGLDTILVGAPNWVEGITHAARSHGFLGEVLSLWR